MGQDNIAGRTVLLHGEQGYGDTIQFCRYVRKVADRGAHVILEVPSPLQRLLSELQGAEIVVAYGQPLPAFDYHCPILSLPLAFGTKLATIPPQAHLTVPLDLTGLAKKTWTKNKAACRDCLVRQCRSD